MLKIGELKELVDEQLKNNNTENGVDVLEQLHSSEKFSEELAEDPEVLSNLLKLTDTNRKCLKILYPLLFSLVKENTEQSLKLSLQCIPTTIWLYLSSLRSDEPSEAAAILSHLATNLSDISTSNMGFRMPTVHVASVYHNPAKMHCSGGLTEANLARGFNMEPIHNDRGYGESFTEITASNRLSVLTILCEKYVHLIKDASPVSLERFLRLCVWLSVSGTPSLTPSISCKWEPCKDRFSLNRALLTSLVQGIQHCIFNGYCTPGKIALECVLQRAEYEVYPEIMMLCYSLTNSLDTATRRPFGIALPDLSGTLEDQRPQRRSIVRQEDINVLLRKRISSNEIREELGEVDAGVSPAGVMLEVSDSEGSEIHTAGFRAGRLQNV